MSIRLIGRILVEGIGKIPLPYFVFLLDHSAKIIKANKRRISILSLSGAQFKMREKIINKLEKAGATAKRKAVTIEEAELTLKEQQWLSYFAGAFLGKIKKTEDKRYYI